MSAPPSALPALLFTGLQREYNVVIHIRVGDLCYPASPAFLQNVKSSLDILLQDEHVHYYFIAEDPKAGDRQAPKGFEYILKTFNGTQFTFLNNLDVRSSLYHMMNADMLIMTGSGFPYIAAVTSWKPVVLHGPNKVGEYEMFQHRDWIRVDKKGVIYEPRSLSEVYRKITVKKHLFHGKTVPY
jgi:hypothetical protein